MKQHFADDCKALMFYTCDTNLLSAQPSWLS